MALANTSAHYGGVTKTFHWLTALLILTAIPLGVIANGLAFDTDEQLARKALLFSLHKTVGVTAFFVAAARILWALTQPKPAPLHPERRLETALADLVHWLLYISLMLVPLSGWIHHAAAAGFAPIWWPFGQTLPLVPQSEPVAKAFASLHFVFTKVLAAAVILHIAGAMKHRFVDRDATLARMMPGHPAMPEPRPAERHLFPALAAVAIYAAATGLGFALIKPAAAPVAETTQPEPAADTGWLVESGALEITIAQLGSPVTGTFSNWNAAISFDPDAEGELGAVDVTILIPSLTLGSVTDQAMGADFFDSASYPAARFTAPILRDADGLVASGTLDLKGVQVPVDLPFTLELEGDRAIASGRTRLDRRDFGIGQSYADESSLGFGVDVSFELTATRSAQ